MAESGGLFVIDAETGDTSQFTSTRTENAATITATTGSKNNGSYGFDFYFDGASNDLSGNKTVSNETDIYCRFYVYIDSNLEMDGYKRVYLSGYHDGSTRLFQIAAYNSTSSTGPATRWRITGESLTDTIADTGFATDTWIRIELHWKAGTGADGGGEIWVDGTSIFSQFDQDLTAYAVDNCRVGTYEYGDTPSVGHLYYDDIKADTSYVGAYSDSGGGRISRYHDLSGLGAHGQLAFNPLS